jgi:hypothetical protein
MKTLTSVTVALLLASLGIAEAESDETAFKARVAACQTKSCTVNIAHLYLELHKLEGTLGRLEFTYPRREGIKAEIAQIRAQLNDPEIQPMMEDGRWEAMSEAQKQEWARKRWGPNLN